VQVDDAGRAPSAALILHTKSRCADDARGYQGDNRTRRSLSFHFLLEKVHITSLNFCESPFFLPELQNRAKHLPQLLKPFIFLPWPYYKQF
jgi:hypothetical protein